jgi:membrane associated rhomboid family serine protease
VARVRISYNAPVVLTFALLAVIVQLVAPGSRWFAAAPEFHGTESYVGLISHILGHGGWDHLIGNFMLILLLGPILEERYGSTSLMVMIVLTALVTGIVNVTFFNTYLVGASGIAFMMILLASTANIKSGEIPLTFIAVAIIYLGGEVVKAFEDDKVSQMAHLVGGVVGAAFGFLSAKSKGEPISGKAPKELPVAGGGKLKAKI